MQQMRLFSTMALHYVSKHVE